MYPSLSQRSVESSKLSVITKRFPNAAERTLKFDVAFKYARRVVPAPRSVGHPKLGGAINQDLLTH